jgi:hypothetical protein
LLESEIARQRGLSGGKRRLSMYVTGASLGDTGQFITGIATLLLALAAAGTALFGVKTYRGQLDDRRQLEADRVRQVAEARGRWLTELLQRFSDCVSFKTVRRELYRKEQGELIRALRRERRLAAGEEVGVLTEAETSLLVALDDYLDFLSLVEYLIDHEQLALVEAHQMFSWYVESALTVPEVKEEIENYFPSVQQLFDRFEAADAH